MNKVFIENKAFDKVDFKSENLTVAEYESCSFKNCNFAEVDLGNITFANCDFVDCNLSLAHTANTAFREVQFIRCKMLGLRFDNCNKFGLSLKFEKCLLSHSCFFKTAIKQTSFNACGLMEADFTACNLTGAAFTACDLAGALFYNTILEKADFRSAYNYVIDPENNSIKKAKFSIPEVAGLLKKYEISIEGF